MTRKSRRLWLLVACGMGLGSATALALDAFSANIVFFVAPSQLLDKPPVPGRTVRLGGMVVAGSLREEHSGDEPVARFLVTDGQQAVLVRYAGILPDLFREGQSVVALGEMGPDRSFTASEVLAKHDETYMPKEVAEALRRSGKWNPKFGPAPSAASWNRMSANTPVASAPGAGTPVASAPIASAPAASSRGS